jgi:hypothetical protein
MDIKGISLGDVIEDMAILRMQLINHLADVRRELDIIRRTGSSSARYQECRDLIERLDSARTHLYVAGEYLSGNGEWAVFQDEEEGDMFGSYSAASGE